MAITWKEIPNSAKHASDSIELRYHLAGEPGVDTTLANRAVAYALAQGYSAQIYLGLYRGIITLDEKGPLLYEVTVPYGMLEQGSVGGEYWSWKFDTTGATKHITHALSHIASYVPAGKTASDHKGAIGFKKNGEVEGVDITDRAFKWSETHHLPISSYSFTYATILGAVTGQMNNAVFRGKAAYTVKFQGASGGISGKDPAFLEITYNFEESPSEANITVGDITVTSKLGWDIASVCYEAQDDDTAKQISTNPYQVDVDRVLYAFDFSILGIGTT